MDTVRQLDEVRRAVFDMEAAALESRRKVRAAMLRARLSGATWAAIGSSCGVSAGTAAAWYEAPIPDFRMAGAHITFPSPSEDSDSVADVLRSPAPPPEGE